MDSSTQTQPQPTKKPESATYLQLILAMVRTGLLGFGGGPSVIPLFKHEAVSNYKWMSDDEFSNVLAIANALPGPIATKLSTQIGYQQRGVLGAIIATIAHIIPTSIGVVFFVSLIYTYKDAPVVVGMIAAVKPVIVVLLGLIAYEFLFRSWHGLGKVFAILFLAISFLLLVILDFHPAIVIILFLAYGTIHLRLNKSKNEN